MTRIELPFPPSVNNLYINTTRGRMKSAGYKMWFAEASLRVKDSHRLGLGHYSISICCRRPDQRKRDLANLEKAVSDLLVEHGVVQDDSLCERLTMQWDDTMPEECVVVVQAVDEGMAA